MSAQGPASPEERLPERLDTERLTIRLWTDDDAPSLHEVVTANVEHLRPWMPWIAFEPLSVDDRRKLIAEWKKSHVEGTDATFGIFLGDTPIGASGLHRRIGPTGIEIGYWIDQAHEGRGYVTEVARALTTAAFSQPNIERVEIHHDVANIRSGGIPERLGYERVGEEPRELEAPGEDGSTVIWRMSISAWDG